MLQKSFAVTMCELIAFDVTLRGIVIIVFSVLSGYFYTFKKTEYPYFTKGLLISLIASIIFLFEGIQLFNGYTDLERLPLCLLVISIWGVGFYFYYKHFSSFFNFKYLNKFDTSVIVLLVLNVTVALSGLLLIIPKTEALFATGLTTTIQGTFTFALTFVIAYRYYKENKDNYSISDSLTTLCLTIGNTSFIFLGNYSIALEIIIVAVLVMSYTYIRHENVISNELQAQQLLV